MWETFQIPQKELSGTHLSLAPSVRASVPPQRAAQCGTARRGSVMWERQDVHQSWLMIRFPPSSSSLFTAQYQTHFSCFRFSREFTLVFNCLGFQKRVELSFFIEMNTIPQLFNKISLKKPLIMNLICLVKITSSICLKTL